MTIAVMQTILVFPKRKLEKNLGLQRSLPSSVQIYVIHIFHFHRFVSTGILRVLDSLFARAPHRYVSQWSWVQIPFKPEFFSGFLFPTAYVEYITAIDIHLFIFQLISLGKLIFIYKTFLNICNGKNMVRAR